MLRAPAIALAAALLLAAGAHSAFARNMSVSNQNIRAVWSSLEFVEPVSLVIRCPVTLEGSFHARTIVKSARSLIGLITRAIAQPERCFNGLIIPFNGTETYNGRTSVQSLPWPITYEGFTGTLPNIQNMYLLLNRFRFGLFIERLCIAEFGTATDNITLLAARSPLTSEITGIAPVAGRNRATKVRADGISFCPADGLLRGTAEFMLLNTASRVTLTLI